MTKADKIKDHQMDKVLDQVRGALSKHPAAFPEIIVTLSNNLDHHDCAKPTKWSAPK